jgi:hypothetical protein
MYSCENIESNILRMIGYDSHRGADSLLCARVHHSGKANGAIQLHRIQATEIGQQGKSGPHFGKQFLNLFDARFHLCGGNMSQMPDPNYVAGYIADYFAIGLLVHVIYSVMAAAIPNQPLPWPQPSGVMNSP